jgi:uroporphyrinogen-III synthase
MRITVPESMKYFCISESTAFYLQKYVVYRKRKIFYGKSTLKDLAEQVKKHKEEKFLLPSTDIYKEETPQTLEEFGITYNQAIIYRTVASDFSDMPELNYDMIIFFSPSGIRSLFKNYPDFKQGNIRIGCFGHTTAKAVHEHGLRLDIMAPSPQTPSMTMALENYLKESNKK